MASDSTCGIYTLEGDTLRCAYTMNKGVRPLDFRGDDPKWTVDVYRRAKP